MSGKYYINTSTDISGLAASQVYDGAPFPVNFKGESFQKANEAKGWTSDTTNVEFPGYKVGSDPSTATTVKAVKIGCYPTIDTTFTNCFWRSSSTGSFRVNRTSSTLVVGGTTFYPSDFRDGVIPQEVALFLVAGGSGGGGNSYYKKDKDNFPLVSGAGGSGGGGVLGWIDLTVSGEKVIYVGKGGAAGSNGTSGKTSKGTSGSQGEDSYYSVGGTKILTALSGVPGSAPTVSDGSYDLPGYPAGYGYRTTTAGGYKYSTGFNGSDGCSPLKTNNVNWNKISTQTATLIRDTGAPAVTICTEKGWGHTCSEAVTGSDTWFSGGNSFSAGAHYDGVGWFEYTSTPGGGGGGSGAQLRTAGANGIALLCY